MPEFESLKKLKHANDLGLTSGKSWNDVLEAYLQEKAGNVAPRPVSVQPAVANIKSVKQIE